MEDKNVESTSGSFASRLRGSWDEDNAGRFSGESARMPESARGGNPDGERAKGEDPMGENPLGKESEETSQASDLANEEDEEARKEAERLEKERKRAETIQKIKTFLYENKDALILSGQLAVVALVCVVGIKNDLLPEGCCKKKRKKKRK